MTNTPVKHMQIISAKVVHYTQGSGSAVILGMGFVQSPMYLVQIIFKYEIEWPINNVNKPYFVYIETWEDEKQLFRDRLSREMA